MVGSRPLPSTCSFPPPPTPAILSWVSELNPITSLTPFLGLRLPHSQLGQAVLTVVEGPFILPPPAHIGPGLELPLSFCTYFFSSEIKLFGSLGISAIFSRIYLFLPLTFLIRSLESLLIVPYTFPQLSNRPWSEASLGVVFPRANFSRIILFLDRSQK